MPRLLCLHVFLICLSVARAFCPSQCTCVFHGRTDGTGTRSVLCNDPDMSEIPTNIPVDTVKLRVEKTAIRKVPAEAFYYLVDLRYLWLPYNAVVSVEPRSFYNLKVLHELRLDGNQLTSFPWVGLREMTRLRTLDLHNNRLASVPAEAAPLLVNVTYLDLSSNQLASLPSDLMDIWPPFSGLPRGYNASHKVVLGLQDNPWSCDCRISKLIELSKMEDSAVVLLDQLLVCSAPESLAGVLFSRAELEQCVKPSVMASATKITSSPGSNVLLRCDATGQPTPVLLWTKTGGLPANSTVVQKSPGEGVRWSIISVHGIGSRDAGEYHCRAKNVAGTVEALIILSVPGDDDAPENGQDLTQKPGGAEEAVTPGQADSAPVNPITTAHSTPTSTTTVLTTKMPQEVADKKPPQDEVGKQSGNGTGPGSPKMTVRSVQVVEESTDGVVLVWKADGVPENTELTVVYSPYDEKVKQTVTTQVGKGKMALGGLRPGTKYMGCLIVKGGQSRREQCVTFFTAEEVELEGGSSPVLVVAGAVACVLALLLVAVLLYKNVSLCHRTSSAGPGADELSRETYVKFETLSLKPRNSVSQPNNLWANRQGQESERMLLCSRSSTDSQVTYKSDSVRSELLC